ncbi:MAG: hypothetical protein Kow0029_27950 [Candidatus Rifleibacteriota bacterium]
MKIQFPKDQGRSTMEKLEKAFSDSFKNERLIETTGKKKLGKDFFDKAPVQSDTVSTDETRNMPGQLNISFQFNLFYELSTKVEAKMGKSGANRFAEVSGTVAETFMGDFSLKIDGVGSFFKNTDRALNISPETTNEFFDAVEGLADLSPDSLQNFLSETENFFNELENTYGEANGAFDQIKEQMQQQATSFFSDIIKARNAAIGQTGNEIANNEETTDIADPEVAQAETQQENNLIQMVFKPDLLVPQNRYQDFLQKFMDYTEKFRQQMLQNFFGKLPSMNSTLNLGENLENKPESNSPIEAAQA